MSRKLFCEYGPVAYEISVRKEAILKDIDDYIIKRYKIAKMKILNIYGKVKQKFYFVNYME